jgi:hypothetical protein
MLKYFKEDYIVMRLNFSHSGWDYTYCKNIYETISFKILADTIYSTSYLFSWNET